MEVREKKNDKWEMERQKSSANHQPQIIVFLRTLAPKPQKKRTHHHKKRVKSGSGS
ncbi:BnaA07g02040D [Brassica napus]|uniref:BnaA07g02040D protein n=1 Tax=Brassica napus TaxID=3708 RepID=A0A078I867_BRANA|nr:BnaA07g02040D [Brassica napus]